MAFRPPYTYKPLLFDSPEVGLTVHIFCVKDYTESGYCHHNFSKPVLEGKCGRPPEASRFIFFSLCSEMHSSCGSRLSPDSFLIKDGPWVRRHPNDWLKKTTPCNQDESAAAAAISLRPSRGARRRGRVSFSKPFAFCCRLLPPRCLCLQG